MADGATQSEPVVIADQREGAAASGLCCQWCSVALPDGTTVCPTCGSPGVPDPSMSLPGMEPALEVEEPHRNETGTGQVTPATLVEWWRDEEESEEGSSNRKPLPSFEETEERRMMTIVFIAGATIFCALAGALIAPIVLDGPIESLTGTPIENPGDLRGMGAFLGMLFGLLMGATGGFVIWLDR